MGKTDIETDIDISILQRMPTLDKEGVVLEIQPLAPLSMVSELPGSYYKTLKMPDKKMLCGLFENVLGWHISIADRLQICKEIKKYRKNIEKQRSKHVNSLFEPEIQHVAYTDYSKGSTFQPLLMDYFEIQKINPKISTVIFFDDLWKKAYSRADAAKTHIGGTPNVSYEILVEKHDVLQHSNDTDLQQWFNTNIGAFPMYYSTPSVREFIDMQGYYNVEMSFDNDLLDMLKRQLKTNNIGYLGNNEGWVNLKFRT